MSVKFGLCKQIALAMFWVELRTRVWINSKIASSLQSSSLSMPTLEPDQIHPFYSGEFKRNVKNGMFRLFFSSDKTKTEATTMKYKEAYRLSKAFRLSFDKYADITLDHLPKDWD